jgi:hypothetical protein
MPHPRRLIRNALAVRLVDATRAEERVFAGRPAPLEEGDLPAIVIHTREGEEVQSYPASGWNGFNRRQCVVMIECYAQSFDDIDDELDDFSDEVERMIESWEIPGFESAEIRLANSSSEAEWDGSLSTGCIKLRYEVTYRTPYRDCANPYVDPDDESIYRSGAYPGGQVLPGCPPGGTGEACPIGDAELFSQEEPIN